MYLFKIITVTANVPGNKFRAVLSSKKFQTGIKVANNSQSFNIYSNMYNFIASWGKYLLHFLY
jgi:hypothetical protein